jgi:hypothetical protein
VRGDGKTVTRDYVESVLGAPNLASAQEGHAVVVYLADGIVPKSTACVVVYDSQENLVEVGFDNIDSFGADFWGRFSQSPAPSPTGPPHGPPAR